MFSLVIPVYNNAESLPRLFREVEGLASRIADEFEVVFVVDGATDRSLEIILEHLPGWSVAAQVLELSRNFGSFAAIAAGLQHGRGDHLAVMSADLQEPPHLIVEFQRLLASGEAEVVLGHRAGRADPSWTSDVFWRMYRRFVVHDTPAGGVDIFGCTRRVRDHLLSLGEVNTNLVALLLWLGFRRAFVPYVRQSRQEGRSGWSFARKVRYALDSIFSFTDLPVRALLILGALGTTFAVAAGLTVFVMWALGRVPVLGYTPLMLVTTFFGGLAALGLGIVGQYQWLTLQNARRRPNFIVRRAEMFEPQPTTSDRNSS